MKRILAFLMALVLVLSLGVTAFAEELGSITITNATVGDTYTLYKIFDANAGSEDGDDVAYSITTDNQFFSYLFGADGTAENPYFTYNADNGAVARKAGTEGQEKLIFEYLTDMIRDEEKTWTPAADPETATSQTVVFSGLPEGYYLIDKGEGTAVTITSNKPNATVIDKNQKPATDDSFQKWVYDEDLGAWVKNSSASVGDIVEFKVEFIATNYDGDKHLKYYTVRDTKGNALWVEFDDINVSVNEFTVDDEGNIIKGQQLSQNRGFYHFAGTDPEVDTGDWNGLGDWINETNPDPNAADWYLIHYGYDEFEIVIPWLSNSTFAGTGNGFTMGYTGDDAVSKYPSPVLITVTYSASVEPNATIGVNQNNNLWNTASLSWTSTKDFTDGPDDPSSTGLTVYALGVEKIDADDGAHLEGAVFGVYRDVNCTQPVYVIPTDIQGVYIIDDLNTDVSGQKRESARALYADYLQPYLGDATQKNEVTSAVNGKLVILGLGAGDYYLKELVAPEGYNLLPAPEHVSVGSSNKVLTVYLDPDTKQMVDEYAEDFATSGAVRKDYTVTLALVENNIGVQLPSTGGTGTMMLITIGTMIAMAFAVLLITHKKMTVYHD